MIVKGSFVEIMQVVLESKERAVNIPEETRKTPLKLWAKGFLMEDCELGRIAKVTTVTGRVLEGVITKVNPSYSHSFGEFIPEVAYIGPQAKSLLWGDKVE
jgi:hypothetical protein